MQPVLVTCHDTQVSGNCYQIKHEHRTSLTAKIIPLPLLASPSALGVLAVWDISIQSSPVPSGYSFECSKLFALNFRLKTRPDLSWPKLPDLIQTAYLKTHKFHIWETHCLLCLVFSVFLVFLKSIVFCVVSVVLWARCYLHLRWYHYTIFCPFLL